MSFLTVLPLAIVMVAGPQILSAIFLATTENWRRNSASFVVGATISISLIVLVVYLLGGFAIGQGSSSNTLDLVVLAILLVAMVNTYRERHQSEPPKWMGKLETADPRFSFRLGFLLLGFFPTDILTSIAVGSYLAAHRLPLTDAIPFILVTLLLLAIPSLAVAALGERATTLLPRVRDWMNENSWIVNEVVILLFIAITISG